MAALKQPQRPSFGQTTIQQRLALFMLAISLIPLVFIAARDIYQTRKSLSKSAELSLVASAEQTSNSLDTFILDTENSIRVESKITGFADYLNLPSNQRVGSAEERAALDLMNTLTGKDTVNILSYSLLDSNGIILLDTARKNLGGDESSEDYFKDAIFKDQPVVTAVKYDGPNTTLMNFASVVKDKSGSVIGVLRVRYNSAKLQQVIVESIGTSSQSYVLLLDPLKIRMADTTNPDLVLKSIYPLTLVDYLIAVDSKRFLDLPPEAQSTNFIELDDRLQDAATTPFFRAEITPNTPGDDTIAVASMKLQPWVVVYARPTSVFLADVQQQTRTNTGLVLLVAAMVVLAATFVARLFTNPIRDLTNTANSISQGNLEARVSINSSDEIGVLAIAFNSMADQLQATLAGLEQRIFERTADLQKRSSELETIANVSREIAIIRDLDTLLNVSASLIRERMSYYHVGIFLLDSVNENAVLRAASSNAADQMLELHYKIKVNQSGPLGLLISTGQAQIVLDVGPKAVTFDNPYLLETRSQIILPLKSNNIITGILDIQANVPNAFDERDIQTLQILADQLSAAIESAQLVQQVEGTLTELTKANRAQVQQVWQTAVNRSAASSFEYDGLQMRAVPQNISAELLAELKNGIPIVYEEKIGASNFKASLLIPLMVLDQIIGVIGLEQDDPSKGWTEDEIAVAQAAANRAALTLENARLLEESLRRASKERTIFESTSRIGSALNIENILQITAEELERVLGDSEVIIQFNRDSQADEDEG